ncbi:MAG: MFS transporter [Alphaproteobacteria bacterium]
MVETLVADGSFVRLWLTGFVTSMVRWLEVLAAGVYTYEVTGSGLSVALVAAARTLPLLAIGAVVGAVAEAVNRKRLLIAGQIAYLTSAAALFALAATGTIEIWHLFAGGLVSGIAWAGELSVRRRMIGEVAGRDRIAQGLALDSVTNSFTRMSGPIAGGATLQLLGLDGVYLVSIALQAAGLVLVLGLAYREQVRPLDLRRIPAEISEGLAAARARPVLMGVLAITVIMNAFGFCYGAMIPALGRDVHAVSPTLVGLLAAAEGAGAIVGGLLIAAGRPRLSHGRIFAGGTMLLLVGVALAALSPWYGLALPLLFLAGLGTAGFGSMQSTLVMTESPPEARSRMMGILTVCIGTAPLGVLAIGILSDRVGPAAAMLAMAVAGLLLLALALRRWPALAR